MLIIEINRTCMTLALSALQVKSVCISKELLLLAIMAVQSYIVFLPTNMSLNNDNTASIFPGQTIAGDV